MTDRTSSALAALSSQPPIPGFTHPAVRSAIATLEALDAADFASMTFRERVEVSARIRGLLRSLRRTQLRVVAEMERRGTAAESGLSTAQYVARRTDIPLVRAEALVREARAAAASDRPAHSRHR
jgi:hypothetical protein